MSNKLSVLNYSELWLKFGFLTEEELEEQIKIFETGEDTSTEHYRYRTFQKYLKLRKELTDDEIDKYLHLAKIDEDRIMASSAVVDLFHSLNLTDNQFSKICETLPQLLEKADKIIFQQQLVRKLYRGVTEEVFEECIENGSWFIHNLLIEFADKYEDKGKMELLAQKGANKAVRNIAKQKLRSRKFR